MTRIRWWHWTLGTYLIITIWFLGSPVLQGASIALLGTNTSWKQLVNELVTFIPFFVATPLVWRYLLKRNVTTLINVSGRVSWRRIALGFSVWFTISLVSSVIDYVINASDYRWSFTVSSFIPTALAVAVLLPMQSSAEEFFFRGWLLQWMNAWSTPLRVMFSGAIFALPHLGNPEAAGHQLPALAAWFILGAGWALVSARDGSIELALGAHFANNAFSLLVVGYDGSVLPTSALFTTSQLNMEGTAIALALAMTLFVFITRRK